MRPEEEEVECKFGADTPVGFLSSNSYSLIDFITVSYDEMPK